MVIMEHQLKSGDYGSIRTLRNTILLLVEKGDLDQALHLIRDCVERVITEPLCTAQAFASKTLDELCRYIGGVNLKGIRQVSSASRLAHQNSVFVYIVTKLYKSGGHTRVIEDFIKARPWGHHVILSTELEGKSDLSYIENGIAKQSNVIFNRALRVNYQKRLTWLQNRLLELQPEKAYLFNHHQDSVAVAAMQPEMGIDSSFYHHGDHHLCLGVYLSHCTHIDPHPMGYYNCRDVLGIENIYIPLTIGDKGNRSANSNFLHQGTLTTCTAARSNKVEIPYFVSYLETIPKLLKSTGGKHIHIGRLTSWALMKLRKGLKRYGIRAEQFIYIPSVPSVWSALHHYNVDLYIASFPYGGGLTLIEAMGAGVPVALHRHFYSRILSGIDLAYPEAFIWRSPEELLEFCSKLTPEYLEMSSRFARLQYLKFHRQEILKDILGNEERTVIPDDLKENFFPQSDEWACWMEKQVSFKRVISRAMYRIFRAMRAKLF